MNTRSPLGTADPDRMHRPLATDVARIADLARERLEGVPPIGGPVPPEALQGIVDATVSPDGIGAEEALRVWTESLAPATIGISHPRYLAFIPGAPTTLASAFDMLVSASNIYGGSWLEGAGAIAAENRALRWIADLTGLPETAGGAFVQGGTTGNLSALVAARERARLGRDAAPKRWAVCVTDETHSSVAHSLRTVMDVDVIVVPGDERGRMTGEALRATVERLDEERVDGVFAVVATAGSTNLGVVDDLAGVGAVAREHGWWLHVDGAYGGAALAAPSARPLFAGIEHADSFIVDPHKWLFGTFDCCALLYRDPAIAKAAHTQHADYLEVVNVDGEWNPSDFAAQLSRRSRGLPLWYSLAAHGTDAYRDAVEHALEVAHSGAELIRRSDHLRLLVEPELSVLVFERIGWNDEDYQTWCDRLMREQYAFITPTRHRGRICARIAVVNPMTTVEDLRGVFDSMRKPAAPSRIADSGARGGQVTPEASAAAVRLDGVPA